MKLIPQGSGNSPLFERRFSQHTHSSEGVNLNKKAESPTENVDACKPDHLIG